MGERSRRRGPRKGGGLDIGLRIAQLVLLAANLVAKVI